MNKQQHPKSSSPAKKTYNATPKRDAGKKTIVKKTSEKPKLKGEKSFGKTDFKKPYGTTAKKSTNEKTAAQKGSEKFKPKTEKGQVIGEKSAVNIDPKKKYSRHTPPKKKTRTPKSTANKDSVSINKYISDTGFCSRREADNYIEQGRVSINGDVALKGNRVMPNDSVEVDGDRLKKRAKTVYIALYKPVGITCTTDPNDKTNIIKFVNHKDRIFPIGRLDKDSEGLILLTNDGDIVNKILRAGNQHEKEYTVVVDKPLTAEVVNKMRNGVPILGGKTLPCFVQQEGKCGLRIKLVQGLNRQIRRMCEFFDYRVTKLRRIRVMNISLGNMEVGHWRYLSTAETKDLLDLVKESEQ